MSLLRLSLVLHAYIISQQKNVEDFHETFRFGWNSAGITPNNEFYSLTNIKTAIKAGVGHTPWIQCNKNAAGTYQLYQVYICIDHSGTVLIDCPVYPTRGECSTSSIQFPNFVGQHVKTSPLETTFNEKGSIEK